MAKPPCPGNRPDSPSSPSPDPLAPTGPGPVEPEPTRDAAPTAPAPRPHLSRRAIVGGGLGAAAAFAVLARAATTPGSVDLRGVSGTTTAERTPSAGPSARTTAPGAPATSATSAVPVTGVPSPAATSRSVADPSSPADSLVTSSQSAPSAMPRLATTPMASSVVAASLGVTAVTSTSKGIWGQDALIASRLTELGVRYIRTGLFSGNNGQITRMRNLASRGIRFNTIMGDPTFVAGTPEVLVQLVANKLVGVVTSFEGANEWNLSGSSSWVSQLRSHQQRVYAAAKGNTRTRSIPVLGPALGMRTGYTELGDLSAAMDVGNIHLYQGGFPPGYRSDEQLADERTVCGSGRSIHVTETGWQNATKSTSTHKWTSEQAAGVYAPRVLLDYLQRGVPRVFFHELVDEPQDTSMTDPEAHFGLLRNDFSRKPAFVALSNFMKLLDAPGTAMAKPIAPLQHRFLQAPSDLHSILAARKDGSYVVFLWRDVSVWDVNRKVMLPVASKPVTVGYPAAANVQVVQPNASTPLKSSSTGVKATELALGGEVVALVVTPA